MISKTIISLEMRVDGGKEENCLIKIEWTMSNDSNFIDNLKFRPHHVICRSAHATIFSTSIPFEIESF